MRKSHLTKEYQKHSKGVDRTIAAIYQNESRRVFATLIRLLRGFNLAEEALQDAFAAALKQWPGDGIPANPTAWLISTGRYKAIDAIRRRAGLNSSVNALVQQIKIDQISAGELDDAVIKDDMLGLIFTCCHPALPPEARVALTLREVCGFTTEEVADAFLIAPTTVAQRIVRANAKIRAAHIPYEVPTEAEIPQRLESLLRVIYLIFNEGYLASGGDALTRPDLCGQAIRLGRLSIELIHNSEAIGLLALMLLTDSRRAARTTPEGEVVLLRDQNRQRWNRQMITEGMTLMREAMTSRSVPTACRRQSLPSMPRHRALLILIGTKSSSCMTRSRKWNPLPLSPSTGQWLWPSETARWPGCSW